MIKKRDRHIVETQLTKGNSVQVVNTQTEKMDDKMTFTHPQEPYIDLDESLKSKLENYNVWHDNTKGYFRIIIGVKHYRLH